MSTAAPELAKPYIEMERTQLLDSPPGFERLYNPQKRPIGMVIDAIDQEFGVSLYGSQTGASLILDSLELENPASPPKKIEQDLKKRADLFARSYAQQSFSAEEEIRLKILTERAIIAVPRVTNEDFADLKTAKKELDDLMDGIRDIL